MPRITEGGGRQFTGDRKDLPDGTYKVIHTYEENQWKDDDTPSLRLTIRKADEENCVNFLSMGKIYGNRCRPSDDGKTLVPAEGEVSGSTSGMAYIKMFAEKAGISMDDALDLNNLDKYPVQLIQIPNTHHMAKPGAKKVQLVDVKPPFSQPTRPSAGASGANGEAGRGGHEDRQKAIAVLQMFLDGNGMLDFSDRTAAVQALKDLSDAESAIDKVLIASMALEDESIAGLVGCEYDRSKSLIVRQ